MPSDVVTKLIAQVSKLEARVENLMDWQKWQMGVLAVILIAAVKVLIGK